MSNDPFAEMVYNYLTDSTPYMHITIKTFLKKFILFWPKRKEPVPEDEDEHQKKKKLDTDDYFLKQAEERKRLRDLNRVAFSFYDTD